jgi:hypothetical protein
MGKKGTKDKGNGYFHQTRTACYHPPTYIFSVDKCELWAGRNPNVPDVIPSRKIDPDTGFDLVLNCTNSSWKPKALEHTFPAKLKALFKLPYRKVWAPVPQIDFDMKDGSAPWEFTLEFWQALTQMYKGKRLLVYCVGGHGRTGTVLGAFLAAAGCMQVADMVRKYHCEEAIETSTQEKYLDYMEEQWAKREEKEIKTNIQNSKKIVNS